MICVKSTNRDEVRSVVISVSVNIVGCLYEPYLEPSCCLNRNIRPNEQLNSFFSDTTSSRPHR
jgi:hypothetical protein